MNLDILVLRAPDYNGYNFAAVNSYNFFSADRAAAYTQPNLNV